MNFIQVLTKIKELSSKNAWTGGKDENKWKMIFCGKKEDYILKRINQIRPFIHLGIICSHNF